MQAKQATLLCLLACLALVGSYAPCSVIKFNDFSYDLTGLKTATISSQNNQFYTKFFPCAPQACDANPGSQKSFVQKAGNSVCQPYTINTTIFQNFNYIDAQSPKIGIKINYLPYVSTASTANGTIQTTYRTQFNLFCLTITNDPQTCIETTSEPNSVTLSNGTTRTSITNTMVCSLSVSSGCPSLTITNFWQFLSNNSIWFAIVIWIFSIFELFMGYFVIRLTIMLYGILTGAVFGIIFSAQNYVNFFNDDSGNSIIIFVILLSFLMGILFGLALLTLPRLGYVNIGMWDAIIFSLLLQNSFLYLSGSMLGFYITLGVTCLIMFAISLLRFRKFIILSTPFISAFWIVRTLGFVLPYYPNEFASEKLFAINASTPWQFYLYLASIIILSVLGCAFQFCWYKKKGRDHGNKGYYLEDDDNIKEKLKKFLQFKDVKDFLNAGKEEMMFLKKLVVDRQSNEEELSPKRRERHPEIEMIKMSQPRDKEKADTNQKKRSQLRENQYEYNKKQKKVEDSDSDPQEEKEVKVQSPIKKSNKSSKIKSSNTQKQMKQMKGSSPDVSNSQQEKREIKGKKRKN